MTISGVNFPSFSSVADTAKRTSVTFKLPNVEREIAVLNGTAQPQEVDANIKKIFEGSAIKGAIVSAATAIGSAAVTMFYLGGVSALSLNLVLNPIALAVTALSLVLIGLSTFMHINYAPKEVAKETEAEVVMEAPQTPPQDWIQYLSSYLPSRVEVVE